MIKKITIKLCLLVLTAVVLASCSLFYTELPAEEQSSQPQASSAPAASQASSEQPAEGYSFGDELKSAYNKNQDTVAWLYIPGTDINNSVLQGFDNNQYMRLNENKDYDVYGCYFADYDNIFTNDYDMSRNTIIFGHSDLKDNPDGKRFSQLFKFTDKEFAEKTPYIYLTIENQDVVFKVFSAFYTNVSFKDYIYPDLSDTKFMRVVEKAKAGSVFNYDVEVDENDKIITLSTCSVRYGTNGRYRFVVMGRMLRDGEEIKTDDVITLTENADAEVQQ